MTRFQVNQQLMHNNLFSILNSTNPKVKVKWAAQAVRCLVIHDILKEMNE